MLGCPGPEHRVQGIRHHSEGASAIAHEPRASPRFPEERAGSKLCDLVSRCFPGMVRMYRVRVMKVVWAEKRKKVDAWRARQATSARRAPRAAHLSFDLEIPFAPHPGITLIKDAWDSGPLEKVRWRDSDQSFICLVAETYLPNEKTYLAAMQRFLELGWKLTGEDEAP